MAVPQYRTQERTIASNHDDSSLSDESEYDAQEWETDLFGSATDIFLRKTEGLLDDWDKLPENLRASHSLCLPITVFCLVIV